MGFVLCTRGPSNRALLDKQGFVALAEDYKRKGHGVARLKPSFSIKCIRVQPLTIASIHQYRLPHQNNSR